MTEPSRHHVPRMIPGLYVGPGQVVLAKPRSLLSAVLPVLSADAERDTTFVCLDLCQRVVVDDSPTRDWEWKVISEIGRYSHDHAIGLNLGERWRFMTWEYGDRRTYTVAYASPLEYVRIADLYGPHAARCAWPHDKAMQLTLTRFTG